MSQSAAGKRMKDRVIFVAVIVVALGGLAIVGFYQEEIGGFFRLQGWNLSPVADVTREFFKAAAADDGAKVATFCKAGAPRLEAMMSNGKVTGFKVTEYGGPTPVKLKALAPNPNPTLDTPRMTLLDGGSVTISATFPKHILELRWDNTPAGWKLLTISRQAAFQGK